MLRKRQEKIKGELDSAAKDMAEAKDLKAEYESRLKDIDKEAENILSEARKKALANESKIVAEAKEEAARFHQAGRLPCSLLLQARTTHLHMFLKLA